MQGTIGIGFEEMQISGGQPEMKEKRKQPPAGVMITGTGLSYAPGRVDGWEGSRRS